MPRNPRRPFNVEPYLDAEGRLIHHAFPGAYPVYYITGRQRVLCPRCADRCKQDLVGAQPNYEDPHLRCLGCNDRIESAYAEEAAC